MSINDACRGLKADVHIGKNCFIGDRTIVLPGVTIVQVPLLPKIFQVIALLWVILQGLLNQVYIAESLAEFQIINV